MLTSEPRGAASQRAHKGKAGVWLWDPSVSRKGRQAWRGGSGRERVGPPASELRSCGRLGGEADTAGPPVGAGQRSWATMCRTMGR